MRSILFSLLVLCALAVTIQAQKSHQKPIIADDPHVKKIDVLLTGLESQGLDGVILIRSHDKTLLHKAYGLADRDAKRPMLLTTGFDIGSLVKSFTKAAILKLEEQGKLSTADTLDKYFKDVPDDKKKITIDQVLAHKAGMADSFGSDYDVVSRDWLQSKAFATPLIAVPGEKANYSNSGYSLLAMIIEIASGKTYEKFVRDEILKPVKSDKIGYILAGWKKGDLAVGFYDGQRWGTPLDKKWAHDGPSWNLRGNGGMLAPVDQTSNWFEAMFEGKVLGPAATQKFIQTSTGMSRSLGVGLMVVAGGNDVFNSIQYSVVESDFHFNFSTSNSKFVAEELMNQFRDDLTALAKDAIAAK